MNSIKINSININKIKIKTLLFIISVLGILLLTGCSNPKACTQEAKICPDGSAVGREGPNCEFQKCPEIKLKINECNASERDNDCQDMDSPVCGWFNESVKCVKYPCAADYGSPCWACSVPEVDYWTQGPCPKTDAEMLSACEAAGGNWIAESKECEGISKEQCSIMNGEFNECASACRNDPNDQVCTLQCVIVCKF